MTIRMAMPAGEVPKIGAILQVIDNPSDVYCTLPVLGLAARLDQSQRVLVLS